MKITPIEIRQKSFERTLRGYDKDEVNAFLLSLSQEWERTMDEAKELRMKWEACEREVAKLREVETSLFKTLKTAETTGANVIDQANKAAELHVKEAQIRAEALMNEARDKAHNTIEEADVTAKQLIAEMEDNMKEMVNSYKTIESHRNNLVDDLKRLANEVIDRAGRVRYSTFSADDHFTKSKREVKKAFYPPQEEKMNIRVSDEVSRKAEPSPEPMRSFFDEVA